MKTFVITLKGYENRLKKCLDALNNFHIDYEIVEGIVGKHIDRANNNKVYNQDSVVIRHNILSKTTMLGKITDGELGCAMSHLLVYEKIIEKNLDFAIVVEDDFIVNTDISGIFTEAISTKKDIDVISAIGGKHGLRQSIFIKDVKLQKYNNSIYRVGVPYFNWFLNRRRRYGGTVCYCISNKACRKLIKLGYPVRLESDVLLGMLAYNKLKYYTVRKNLGIFDNCESSIGEHGSTRFI